MGRVNAIVGGRGNGYHVPDFPGVLSIKSVVSGSAIWQTSVGRFEIGPGTALVLNHGEDYSLTIDARDPVETFCLFFARGFVEDAYRSAITPSERLLDAAPPERTIEFAERLLFDPSLLNALRHARQTIDDITMALVRAQCDVDARAAALPVLRASTRAELRRRIDRGVAFMHANLERPITTEDAARAACLSRFHFHRLFVAMYGESPHRYLSRLRLERGRALLLGSDDDVTAIAFRCGFGALSAFSTAFTRRFGVPPGSLRKKSNSAKAQA